MLVPHFSTDIRLFGIKKNKQLFLINSTCPIYYLQKNGTIILEYLMTQ